MGIEALNSGLSTAYLARQNMQAQNARSMPTAINVAYDYRRHIHRVSFEIAGRRYGMDITKETLRDAAAYTKMSEHDAILHMIRQESERLSVPRFSQADMDARLDDAYRDLQDLKRRFQSLFGVPVDSVSPAEVTTEAGQMKVRVHVAAFTVETTIGTLAAARTSKGAAITWDQKLQADGDARQNDIGIAMLQIGDAIRTRIIEAGTVEIADPAVLGSSDSSSSTDSQS